MCVSDFFYRWIAAQNGIAINFRQPVKNITFINFVLVNISISSGVVRQIGTNLLVNISASFVYLLRLWSHGMSIRFLLHERSPWIQPFDNIKASMVHKKKSPQHRTRCLRHIEQIHLFVSINAPINLWLKSDWFCGAHGDLCVGFDLLWLHFEQLHSDPSDRISYCVFTVHRNSIRWVLNRFECIFAVAN